MNYLKILNAQLQNDIKDVIESLEGDVNWSEVIKANERLLTKMNDWKKVSTEMIEKAEAKGQAENDREAEFEAEQAERSDRDDFSDSRGVKVG